MAKKENLRPFRSKSEARERGRKGGIASGEARRLKKSIRDRLVMLLETKCDGGITNADAIAMAIMEKAKRGDVQAFATLRDTVGEKPVDRANVEHSGSLQTAQVVIFEVPNNGRDND